MIEFIKLLSGYSGCHVHLYKKDNKYFVRKISGSTEYNKRLERQIVKQASFKHPVIRAPQVYKTGYINGYFYADMEYIDGKTIAEIIRQKDYLEADKAIYNVITLFAPTNTVLINAQDIVSKISDIHTMLCKFDDTELCKKALQQLNNHTWETHPIACHGDLTLENILVKDGTVYLVDFLDTFHDCLEIDIAKLLQDLLCMWSFRYSDLAQEDIDFLQICSENIINLYTKITGSSIDQIYAMLKLTLLRIYPYIKDNETKMFLDKKLEDLL